MVVTFTVIEITAGTFAVSADTKFAANGVTSAVPSAGKSAGSGVMTARSAATTAVIARRTSSIASTDRSFAIEWPGHHHDGVLRPLFSGS